MYPLRCGGNYTCDTSERRKQFSVWREWPHKSQHVSNIILLLPCSWAWHVKATAKYAVPQGSPCCRRLQSTSVFCTAITQPQRSANDTNDIRETDKPNSGRTAKQPIIVSCSSEAGRLSINQLWQAETRHGLFASIHNTFALVQAHILYMADHQIILCLQQNQRLKYIQRNVLQKIVIQYT